MANLVLDDFDRAILDLVQRDNRLTHSALGSAVGLSPSAVRRRLKVLREQGVITADVAIVDPACALTQAVVLVTFRDESLRSVQAFKDRMVRAPEVSQCFSVAGGVDFVLVVQLPDLESLEAWGERVLMSDSAIRRYDTHIVWSRVKYSTAVTFLPEPSAAARA